jgi:hypothetical protein
MIVLSAFCCVLGGVGTVEAIVEAGALGGTVTDLVRRQATGHTLGHALDLIHPGRF